MTDSTQEPKENAERVLSVGAAAISGVMAMKARAEARILGILMVIMLLDVLEIYQGWKNEYVRRDTVQLIISCGQ